jgi:diguanylate cyclase (GGDEF)-like protein
MNIKQILPIDNMRWLKQCVSRRSAWEEFGLTESEVAATMEDIYRKGDRLMSGFLLMHFGFALALATFHQTWVLTLIVSLAALSMFFLSRWLLPRTFLTRCLAGVALQIFVALHIYQMHGLPEMHFTFFTACTMMIVYKDWRSMWPGTILIIAQHTLFAVLQNSGYDIRFFPDSAIAISKLVFHFGIALLEVGICGYWCILLRRRTLEGAFQRAQLKLNSALLEAQLEKTMRSEKSLQEQTERLLFLQKELEQANQILTMRATTDGLTGLKNHREFYECLSEELARSRRSLSSLSVVMIDVDLFKRYNDDFGHPAGDLVLKMVANLLHQLARESDTVARYGGEEFAVLLPETNAADAVSIAERFRSAVESYSWTGAKVTASFGVATVFSAALDASALISEADKALYRSKHSGRNCVTHFTDPAPEEGGRKRVKAAFGSARPPKAAIERAS